MIYLDNAATTALDPRVFAEMMPYLTEEYGNPGSLHAYGRRALDAIEEAREKVAAFINCDARQVIFTSGATEANNAVMHNLSRLWRGYDGGGVIVISETEHDSIENSSKQYGFCRVSDRHLTNDDGTTSLDALKEIAIGDAGLADACSVQYVNNETGAVNPVREIGRLCRANGVLFHSDCVQAAGFLPINVEDMMCDFATISSHKIHGPKGVGALYVRDPDGFHPLITGGSEQEFGKRGGTENVAAIVGFGKAVELASEELDSSIKQISMMKNMFYGELLAALASSGMSRDIVHINGPSPTSPGRILNLRIDGVDGETLVLAMDAAGVCISAGSACRSKSVQPSRVLLAMGLSPIEARQSVRISFSRDNTFSETYDACQIMADCIGLLTGGGL